ncbi:hypothetical protein OU997_11855 [Pseudomonas sp. SL4(2022)]|uniref:hypothetical protein n=1 Tax=Pseudomonas sp. SL4(2022) TaxID=2994661 RepID=UPI00227151DD|nr:hypothetical protein [Pseudomonas sp. SL4(2022)]WAC42994.1 hypothetical protein OU997_11855 [Pseudomonas sp. SL4(2022)]
MNKLFYALTLITMTLAQQFATANEIGDSYIEHADLILNLEKSKVTNGVHGYLLATPCSNCPQKRIEVADTTEIFLKGKPADPNELTMKIDWQGMVFFNSGTPAVATRLMLQ